MSLTSVEVPVFLVASEQIETDCRKYEKPRDPLQAGESTCLAVYLREYESGSLNDKHPL